MSKERFGGSYLIRSNPVDKKCFIGIYDAEGKLHEIFNGPKSRHKDLKMEKHPLWGHLWEYLKHAFNPHEGNEFKREIKKAVGYHVYLVPVKTREDYWSFKKELDEQLNREEPEISSKFKIHRIDEGHPYHMKETDDHFEIDEFDSFTKGDAGEVIKFFKKNIFNKTKE